ncbi:hypothetical protein HDV05_003392 [Chytridiales sp. JEL 0842]|nr:hypothetical protein HDV05_003392 [Chytridiales sp. JEL 0842]
MSFQVNNGGGYVVLNEHKSRILNETKNVSSFVVIGQTLYKLYYEDKLMKTQKEFLEWTKQNLGFSKSTTYEYIISYRIYSQIARNIPKEYRPPMYQSHCQLLSKVPQDKLVETWVDVCRQAPNGVITTAFLELYLDRHQLRGGGNTKGSGGKGNSSLLSVGGGSSSSAVSSPKSTTNDKPASKRSASHIDAFDAAEFEQEAAAMHDKELSNASSLVASMSGVDGSMVDANGSPSVSLSSTTATSTSQLPINESLIFELSKGVVLGHQFEMVLHCVEDFKSAEHRLWFGRVWANLTTVRPLTTASLYASPSTSPGDGPVFEGGLEHLLRIIFTKFAGKEFAEGLFLLRAEFGADWFTPILQHPYCVLRHTNPPAPTYPKSGGGKRRKGQSYANVVATPPPFESYVMFYLGPNIKEFCHVFRAIGLVAGINSWSAVMSVSNVLPNVNLLNPNVLTHPSADAQSGELPLETMANLAAGTVQNASLSEAASALCDIARYSYWSLFLILSLSHFVLADLPPAISNLQCQIDDDCAPLNKRLPHSTGSAGYICVKQLCSYTVIAGEICHKASDCSQYQWVKRQQEKNLSASIILGKPDVNIDEYLSGLCSPKYCTIASFCDSPSDPLFLNRSQSSLQKFARGEACCGGGEAMATCIPSLGNTPLPTCDLSTTCQVSSDFNDINFYCSAVNKRSTLWIGVIITLIGAAFLNVGLNLQKLALRKRHEKTQAKKLQKRMVERLSAIRLGAIRFPSFNGNLKKRASSTNESIEMDYRPTTTDPSSLDGSSQSNLEGDQLAVGREVGNKQLAPPNPSYMNHVSRNHLDLDIDNPAAPALRITARSPTSATVTREDGSTEDIPLPSSPEDKAEFQKNLDFASLVKNPIWVLGMVIFIFSNFLNFIALQFAPQSLVAPLGSISLVVNVVLAPLINQETFTWKDIVGVVMIVAGSSMTVAFAGVNYKLCVLLALFRRVPTIIFLTATAILIVVIFFTIVIIEKNLDLPGSNRSTNEPIIDDEMNSDNPRNPPPAIVVELAEAGPGQPRRSFTTSKVYTLGSMARRASQMFRPNNTEAEINTAKNESGDTIFDHEKSRESTVIGNETLASSSAQIHGALSESIETSSFLISSESSAPAATLSELEVLSSTEPLKTSENQQPPMATLRNRSSFTDEQVMVLSTPSATTASLIPRKSTSTPDTNLETQPARAPSQRAKMTWKQTLLNSFPSPLKNMILQIQAIEILPRFKEKIPLDSKLVRVVLPFSYASLGGLMATITVLFAKSTIHLLSTTFFENENQYNNIYAWLITAVTIITAVSQVYWINMGLQRYDALLQIPVFYVVWTLFDVIGGGVYFSEFDGFNSTQYALFFLAVGIIFVGVGVLGDRLKNSHV